MAELYPDGQVLTYEGDDPPGFREQARARLGLDTADDDRWELAAHVAYGLAECLGLPAGSSADSR